MYKKHQESFWDRFHTAIKVGSFLAYRDIKNANKWTTALIVFVMTLTFLNLIVISGILVGLIQGSVESNKKRYSGDIIISPLLTKEYVENSQEIISITKTIPGYLLHTYRYAQSGRVESNYKETLLPDEKINSVGGIVAGINPVLEDKVTGLSEVLIEGTYLMPGDTDKILIGADLLYKYTPIESPSFSTLKNIEVGSRVRLTVGSNVKEYYVKGIIKSKAGDVDQRIFMIDSELRKLAGRNDLNVDEIAIVLKDDAYISVAKDALVRSGVEKYARVQTAEDAEPKFLQDIKATFSILGNVIGSIGLAVASITIFIVIFVNAITRRRFIGILKGIGIDSRAIIFSYILQSLFYALLGVLIGTIIIFGFLKPYFDANPINFPFSDGILVATPVGTFIRAMILLVATLIAGFIPARIVIRQNTLDAILGR
ncbi:MAG: FtsX-like permease family protein [Candidatus Pacebacteria bacterium]|nr:FtsX-like permease family protein [Candidatus Paceibacterota bacterium]MBP9780720.1 FtsX-like permease family protein [Candidatus Paceibacterota bacterium]MDQ5949761.1 FtsX protein [Patescibacteria group bacterium]MDQ5961823.1 FtsX protein [Patescibacteria group bacterium]